MLIMSAPGPIGGLLSLPVSLLADSSVPVFNLVYVRKAGPGPIDGLSSHHPFHCWGCFRTCRILDFLLKHRAIQGGSGTSPHHPFHCWVLKVTERRDTLLARKPRNVKTTEKTLG